MKNSCKVILVRAQVLLPMAVTKQSSCFLQLPWEGKTRKEVGSHKNQNYF